MIGGMPDTPDFSEIAFACQNLSQIESIWLLGWNIADGQWGCIGLDEAAGRGLLLDLFGKLHGGSEIVNESSGRFPLINGNEPPAIVAICALKLAVQSVAIATTVGGGLKEQRFWRF